MPEQSIAMKMDIFLFINLTDLDSIILTQTNSFELILLIPRQTDLDHRCLFPPIDGGELFLPPHFSGPWGGTRPPIFRDPGGEIFVCPPKKMGGAQNQPNLK